MAVEHWDIWYPETASRGLLFGAGSMDATYRLWVHAAPPVRRVEVRDALGRRLAIAEQLEREGDRLPMTLLERSEAGISRVDRWPVAGDMGSAVMLPGGEVGVLRSWWNANDGSA